MIKGNTINFDAKIFYVYNYVINKIKTLLSTYDVVIIYFLFDGSPNFINISKLLVLLNPSFLFLLGCFSIMFVFKLF